ncbi:MAG: efflux RND transporter permease subunit [Prochloraceae cyanobacterium]|nr:efflux RND transporter permease subunit [Prochloraceae cyanobacterium]
MQRPKKKSFRELFNISRLAIQHSWLVICFWLAVTVAGLFAFSSLKYALFPDVTFPVVIVRGEAPLETTLSTESQLTKPLEKSLESLKSEGLDILSHTYPGQAAVSIIFDGSSTLKASTEKVTTLVKQAVLPPEAELEVIPFNLNESGTISYALKSKTKTLTQLKEIAKEEIIPSLSQVPGLLRINLLGNSVVNQKENPSLPTNTIPSLVRVNGENAIGIGVVKKGDANTLEVVNRVEKEIQKLEPKLKEVQLVLAVNQADFIGEATQATIDALIMAMVLAILVIVLFLRNLRASLIAALAIPISLLGTCIVMAVAGLNLETITLLGLALVIGIIIDDSIVDVENISRHIERGMTPRKAAILGTDEIGLTVVASTCTIAAVFLPVAFMGGDLGKFFKPFGLTVSAAVIISLLVARTLCPVLAVYWLKPRKRNNGTQEPAVTETVYTPTNPDRLNILTRKYRNLLQWSLNHRKFVVIVTLSTFIAGIALIPAIPKGFIPQLNRNEFLVHYETALPNLPAKVAPKSQSEPSQTKTNSSFNWISDLVASPERFLLHRTIWTGEKLEKAVLKLPEIESVFTVAGLSGIPNQGLLYVKLNSDRQLNLVEVQQKVRDSLPDLRTLSRISIEDIPFVDSGQGGQPLQVTLLGDDLKVLDRTARKLETEMKKIPGLVDVNVSGLSIQADAPLLIERKNGRRTITVSANLNGGLVLGDATEKVVAIAEPILPPEVKMQLGGFSAKAGEVMGDFAVTLALSVTSMLVVLLLLFGRLLEPIVVGLCLPLSIVGALLGLLITQNEFSMISLIGIIFLLGLLDKNVLLLIDYARQLRRGGMNRTEALLETGVVRMRPILMTTASTIVGMLPLALGWGAGADLRQPMAIAIIGGLFTFSILSLIVVPVVYTLLEDFWSKIFKNAQFTKSQTEEREKVGLS